MATKRHTTKQLKANGTACPIASLMHEQAQLIRATEGAGVKIGYDDAISDRIELNEAVAMGTVAKSAAGALLQLALIHSQADLIVSNYVTADEQKDADKLFRQIDAMCLSVRAFIESTIGTVRDPDAEKVLGYYSVKNSGPHHWLAEVVANPAVAVEEKEAAS